MKTYTKEQIIDIVTNVLGHRIFQKDLEDYFNNLENKNFEPWRWYKYKLDNTYILNDPNKETKKGFGDNLVWQDDMYLVDFGWKLATQEQIEPLIRAEAERRGFVEGAKFDSVPEFEGCIKYSRKNQSSIRYIHYNFKIDVLYSIYGVIYEKGRWATLIKEKSLEDRVKYLESIVENLNRKLCHD